VVGCPVADGVPVGGLAEGLELVQPDAALLELSKPQLEEGLVLGVAVAAAAMRDAQGAEDELERAGVNAEPLSVPKVSVPGGTPRA
jgi:hypothetical protein